MILASACLDPCQGNWELGCVSIATISMIWIQQAVTNPLTINNEMQKLLYTAPYININWFSDIATNQIRKLVAILNWSPEKGK